MTKKKRYKRDSPEFKREALKRASEERVTDVVAREAGNRIVPAGGEKLPGGAILETSNSAMFGRWRFLTTLRNGVVSRWAK